MREKKEVFFENKNKNKNKNKRTNMLFSGLERTMPHYIRFAEARKLIPPMQYQLKFKVIVNNEGILKNSSCINELVGLCERHFTVASIFLSANVVKREKRPEVLSKMRSSKLLNIFGNYALCLARDVFKSQLKDEISQKVLLCVTQAISVLTKESQELGETKRILKVLKRTKLDVISKIANKVLKNNLHRRINKIEDNPVKEELHVVKEECCEEKENDKTDKNTIINTEEPNPIKMEEEAKEEKNEGNDEGVKSEDKDKDKDNNTSVEIDDSKETNETNEEKVVEQKQVETDTNTNDVNKDNNDNSGNIENNKKDDTCEDNNGNDNTNPTNNEKISETHNIKIENDISCPTPPVQKRVPGEKITPFRPPSLPFTPAQHKQFGTLLLIFRSVYNEAFVHALEERARTMDEGLRARINLHHATLPEPVKPPIVLDPATGLYTADAPELKDSVPGARHIRNISPSLSLPKPLPLAESNIEVIMAVTHNYCIPPEEGRMPQIPQNQDAIINEKTYNRDNHIRPIIRPIPVRGIARLCLKEHPDYYNSGYEFMARPPLQQTGMDRGSRLQQREQLSEMDLILNGLMRKISEDMRGPRLAPSAIDRGNQRQPMKPLPITVCDDPIAVDPFTRARNIPYRTWGMENSELYKDREATLLQLVWSPVDLLKSNVKIQGILKDSPSTSDKHVTLLAGPLFSVVYEAAPVPDATLLMASQFETQNIICFQPLADECICTSENTTPEAKAPYTFSLPARENNTRFPNITCVPVRNMRRLTRKFVADNQKNITTIDGSSGFVIDLSGTRDFVVI